MVSHLPALCSFARITQKKAAIVLSTSVTFLSLPGLDGITRTPAMVAILFAAFAIAASGVAVLRHKADLERPVSYIGIEGIVGVSVSRFFIYLYVGLTLFTCRDELLLSHFLLFFWPMLLLHLSLLLHCIPSAASL
jgi:hypothetical protein